MSFAKTYTINIVPLIHIYELVLTDLLSQSIEEVVESGGFEFWNTDRTIVEQSYTEDGGGVIFNVSTDNARAFTLEYGSGEFMDLSNPYLNEYIKSTKYDWNKYRQNPKDPSIYNSTTAPYPIVTREAGSYKTFNWETGEPETRVSYAKSPGEETSYVGESPDPQIPSMIDQINERFRAKISSELKTELNKAVSQRFDEIFEEKVERF